MAYEQILVGSGTLYLAAVGTAFPAVNASPGGSWTSLGDFDGGVQVEQPQKVDLHRVDSETGPVKATRSEEDLKISTSLADSTLEKLAKALDDMTVAAAGGPPATKTIGLYRGSTVKEYALLFRGNSPYAAGVLAQYQVVRAVQTGNLGRSYTKEGKTLTPVEFFALVDPTAGTAVEKFGKLVAQTA